MATPSPRGSTGGVPRAFEFPVFILAFGAVLLAAYLVAVGGLEDLLRAPRTWLYVTVLATVFIVARGLAKSGRASNLVGTLGIVVGLFALLTGGLLGTDLRRAEAKPRPAPVVAGFTAPRLRPSAEPGADRHGERRETERRLSALRSRERAWRARARRAERALKQARARNRRSNRR